MFIDYNTPSAAPSWSTLWSWNPFQDTLHGIENKSYGAQHRSRHSPDRRFVKTKFCQGWVLTSGMADNMMHFTGTVEEGGTGTTALMQGTDTGGETVWWSCLKLWTEFILIFYNTGIGAHGVTSIATLTGNYSRLKLTNDFFFKTVIQGSDQN